MFFTTYACHFSLSPLPLRFFYSLDFSYTSFFPFSLKKAANWVFELPLKQCVLGKEKSRNCRLDLPLEGAVQRLFLGLRDEFVAPS